jgi:hypothetical protein
MLVIRPKRYYGIEGFKLSGTVAAGSRWPVSIWTRYRDLAVRLREAYKATGRLSIETERAVWDEELRRNLEAETKVSP